MFTYKFWGFCHFSSQCCMHIKCRRDMYICHFWLGSLVYHSSTCAHCSLIQPSWSRAAAHNALFAKHSIGASLAKTCFEPCVSQSACACNTARYMVTTCIGGNIAPNLTAALGTQVQRHGVALLPHMIVQLLQYTTGLTWQYTQDLQNKEAMSNMHDVLSEA